MAILRSTQVQGKLEVIDNDLYVTGSGKLIHGNLAGTASVAEGLDPTKDIVSIGEFLSEFTFAEFLVFALIFILAIKESINFNDWAKTKFRKATNKALKEKKEHDKIEEEIEDLNSEKEVFDKEFKEVDDRFKKIEESIEMLIESDKEDIKASFGG